MKVLKYIFSWAFMIVILSLFSFSFASDDEFDRNVYDTEIRLRNGTSYYFLIQPQDYYGIIGNTATFQAAVNDPGATPRWQYYYSSGWRNSPLESATSWTLNVPITRDRIGYRYRCVVTLSNGQTITSQVAFLYEADTLSLSDCLSFVGTNVISKIFNFETPWGIAFGAVVVGVFGAPLLVRAYRKFF